MLDKWRWWRLHHLYRNTEKSIILLKRWRGDFRKKEYCQIYRQCFHLEELTQIEWSVSKKHKKWKHLWNKIDDREYLLITVLNLIQTQILDLSEYLFYRLSKFKRLPVVYITIYQKKSDKIVCFGNFFFHWLKIDRTNQKNFDRNFKIWIEYQKNGIN